MPIKTNEEEFRTVLEQALACEELAGWFDFAEVELSRLCGDIDRESAEPPLWGPHYTHARDLLEKLVLFQKQPIIPLLAKRKIPEPVAELLNRLKTLLDRLSVEVIRPLKTANRKGSRFRKEAVFLTCKDLCRTASIGVNVSEDLARTLRGELVAEPPSKDNN